MSDDIKVSVSILSYKHAKYIRQCLDSILAQKVNFKYEIIVGEDCSQDGTEEILMEYKEKYPDIFVLLINEKNMGAAWNNHNIKLHCRGKYITGCESDDFWINENKMQMQVDFLDTHPDYVAVGSSFVNVDVNGNNPKSAMFPWQLNRRYSLKEYLKYGLVIHGNTMMYRNVIPYHDERYVKLRLAEPTMGDVITRVMLYDRGDIFLQKDITTAHRSGEANATSFSARQKKDALYYTRMYFRIVDNLTAYFNGKYDLEPLKANRFSAIYRTKLLGQLTVDPKEFREIWDSLSPRLKRLTVTRCIQKTLRNLLHAIARRISRKKANS